MANEETEDMSIIEQLYKALRISSCRCIYSWKVGAYDPHQHETLEGRVRTYTCPRCAAIERYEQHMAALEEQT